MTTATLNAAFGIPGILFFEETADGLVRAQIATSSANATIYLQGAHLAQWQPAGESPVLFLASQSSFKRGEAVRGGVPLVFPWFGCGEKDRLTRRSIGKHGFARTALWTLRSAHLTDGDIELRFSLTADARSRALGFDCFYLEYALRVGRSLELELTTQNHGAKTLCFEEAFHTYFAIGEIEKASVCGLAGAPYLDAADGFSEKRQSEAELHFNRQTDSVYLGTEAVCVLRDPGNHRQIHLEKSGSRTTVVWNPGEETSGAFSDLGSGDWRKFVCVETANALSDAITLAPGARHRLAARITVQPEFGFDSH